MSLRVMRKVLAQQDPLEPTAGGVEEEAEEEEEPAARPAKSSFGVLWSDLVQEGEGEEEEEEEEEDDEKVEASSKGSSLPASASGGKSKKNKKKKKKKKQQQEAHSEGAASADIIRAADSLDGLGVFEQDGKTSGARPPEEGGSWEARCTSTAEVAAGKRDLVSLLSADPGLLRAEDELKRIFGAKVMREVDKQEAAASSSSGSRRLGASRVALPAARGGARPRQGGVRRQGRVSAGRKFILVQPLDTWPPVEKGDLTMELVRRSAVGASRKNSKGRSSLAGSSELMWFKYVESPGYTRTSGRLQECIDSHDPETMVDLVARHPYHAGGLLALADVFRHTGEAQVAAELLERALYVLESAWHPYFDPTKGNCRLDFAWEPNQVLFLALFRNIQQLSRRGCHRAALECAKLLFSLNPEDDPHGMLLCLDYFALRAEQGQWLEDFVEANSDRSLSVMPNYSFSLALAQFHRELSSEASHEESAELLRDALMLHPYVLPLLVKKAPIQVNADWSKILKSKPFSGHCKISPTLEHLAALYAERSSLLWRPTTVQKWLQAAACSVIDGIKSGGDLEQDYSNWICVRSETFTETTNEYRHLLLADFSDSISTVPPDVLMGAAGAPPGGLGGAHGGVVADGDNGAAPVRQGPPADLQGRNPLAVFFETLMPWNDFGMDPNQLPPEVQRAVQEGMAQARDGGNGDGPREGNQRANGNEPDVVD